MRIIIVSNRLPIAVTETEGKLDLKPSVGGLVSGLNAYLDSLELSSFAGADHLWIGWPGGTIRERNKKELEARALAEFKAQPVFISEKTMDKFYHGFSNKTIWSLFHYFPAYTSYDEDFWTEYVHVNELFCQAVLQAYRPGDVIWIHDYHLMLLPALLRRDLPDASIGFFLHIPFPSFEIFRLLPARWRAEILEGLLGADLIGFHTHDYTQYFLRCVLRILGHEQNVGQVMAGGRIIRADTFPMGIDFTRYQHAADDLEIQEERDRLRSILGDSRVILSVDRLDFTKGILNRLQGYETFLRDNPHWHGRVVLIMVVVPSRTGVERYQIMKRQIDELVGKINGKYSSLNWTPVIYQYKSLSFKPLTALYGVADVALVTPLRDGMNLVAKEYVAARPDRTGVLILSELAGVAKELGEAVIINPNHIEEITEALRTALEMPVPEQIRRNTIMQTRLKRYNVVRWADDFLIRLRELKDEQRVFNARFLSRHLRDRIVSDFRDSRRSLLLLDYDGTLSKFAEDPLLVPPSADVIDMLRRLREGGTDVVIISGRDRQTLQVWFGMLDLGLVAEHGVWIRPVGNEWNLVIRVTADWKPLVIPLMEMYCDQLPGSFIEEKEYGVSWHYRKADPEPAAQRAKELIDDLVNLTANAQIQVLQGAKVVEVKSAGVSKGTAAAWFLARGEYDFILAAGDDWTDEDLFSAVPASAYTLKVGATQSHARFHLRGVPDVIALLRDLADQSPAQVAPSQVLGKLA
ncbi:MAG: bifunctional alpha,alpha-trehalose-phosphate synthase (UDP-forming)/trehalose-phosphatase [Candidatus Zixiibacteriota bacterium]|nr:MAG: bifunctional alpha,alpha-trehalose-phosphate synthase (UDP-forming)/trehalose-phosphatase [candidate division Zixibacteria bacterium]